MSEDLPPCVSKSIITPTKQCILLADLILPSWLQNITEYGCKECEELEEKSFKEFLQSFKSIVQMFINTSWLSLMLSRVSVITTLLPAVQRQRRSVPLRSAGETKQLKQRPMNHSDQMNSGRRKGTLLRRLLLLFNLLLRLYIFVI